ncbi:MAG: adenylate/guanylate cyclase domain-containing protein, partial [Desulfobacterales bacterium]
MNERLDPEEVEAIMSRVKNEAVRIVERHEGIVNQFVGDEVLALFGIPTTHEDDPVRAIKAAREIHNMVRQISPEIEERIGTSLRMHTGISSGLVVTHIRDMRDGSYGITGDAVNRGARLASRAESDEILADQETHSLMAPYFESNALEPIVVKGKAKPLIPYRVTGESAVQTRFDAAKIQGLTAFTGRENELTTLYACLEKTLAGKGQFVTVLGEAGLGKSRLAYEFRHSLNRSAITVLQGRCQSYGKSIPY